MATKPPSEKQVALIERLCAERDLNVIEFAQSNGIDPTKLTGGRTGTASQLIGKLFEIGRGLDGTTRKDPEAGIYLVADEIIVRIVISKSGNWYAQQAMKRPGRTTFTWDYLGKRVDMRGAKKLTDAEAGQFFGYCMRCNAELTDPESIARGIGPVCAKKGA